MSNFVRKSMDERFDLYMNLNIFDCSDFSFNSGEMGNFGSFLFLGQETLFRPFSISPSESNGKIQKTHKNRKIRKIVQKFKKYPR